MNQLIKIYKNKMLINYFFFFAGECKSKTLPRIHIDAPAMAGDGVAEGI